MIIQRQEWLWSVGNRKKAKLTGQWAVHWQPVLDYARSVLSWARWR